MELEKFKYKEKLTSAKLNNVVDAVNTNTANYVLLYDKYKFELPNVLMESGQTATAIAKNILDYWDGEDFGSKIVVDFFDESDHDLELWGNNEHLVGRAYPNNKESKNVNMIFQINLVLFGSEGMAMIILEKGEGNAWTATKKIVGDTAAIMEALEEIKEQIEDIKLFKFPNATIMGEPTINHGQISGFSQTNYLVMPSTFDAKGRAFEIAAAFTTGTDVTTAQNIFGGKFCLALFIQSGKLNLRVSSNGKEWDIVNYQSKFTVEPSKTYYIKIAFDRLRYKLLYSTNGVDYTEDGAVTAATEPHSGLIYIGVGNNFNNPFQGIINFNKCEIKFNNVVVWEGMDDVGLATRLATDLSNLDAEGEEKIKEIVNFTYYKEEIDKSVANVEKLKNDVETYIGSGKEQVVVAITSSVEDVSVSDLTLYVYLNNAENPLAYTTDEHGMATFRVDVGYKYRIVFPTIEGCEPIPDVTHTAGVAQRSVEVEYTDVKVMYEHLTVRLDHWTTTGTKEDLSGKVVKLTIEGEETEELTTDANGTTYAQIPIGKNYRLELPEVAGLYIWENKYTFELKAEISARYIMGNYTDYESGLFIITDNGNEYTFADFKAKGIAPESARLIKISTEALANNSENDNGSSSVFCISIDEIRQRAFQSKIWSSGNFSFTSVGYGYHYNGYKNSHLLYNEGVETGKDTPAIEHALQQEFVTSARKYNGFLGAVYQWTTLWEMREEIDEILDYCRPTDADGNFFNQKLQTRTKAYDLSSFTANKWASCQVNISIAVRFTNIITDGVKYNAYLVVPFYAY